jgi:hypothetical protein
MSLNYLDRETWRFINTFAPWLAAIGTLAAVLFSLYITLADRSRLRVRAWKQVLPTEPRTVPVPNGEVGRSLVTIRVTNTRDKEIFIDEIYWNVGGTITPQPINYTFSVGLDLTSPSMLVGRVPTQIDFDLGTFITLYLPHLVPSLLRSGSRVKIGVVISTGKRFESKIEKGLDDWLREAAKELADQQRSTN